MNKRTKSVLIDAIQSFLSFAIRLLFFGAAVFAIAWLVAGLVMSVAEFWYPSVP